jgi:hypothetical protein
LQLVNQCVNSLSAGKNNVPEKSEKVIDLPNHALDKGSKGCRKYPWNKCPLCSYIDRPNRRPADAPVSLQLVNQCVNSLSAGKNNVPEKSEKVIDLPNHLFCRKYPWNKCPLCSYIDRPNRRPADAPVTISRIILNTCSRDIFDSPLSPCPVQSTMLSSPRWAFFAACQLLTLLCNCFYSSRCGCET